MVDGLWLPHANDRPCAVAFDEFPITAESGGVRSSARQAHHNALTGRAQAADALTQGISAGEWRKNPATIRGTRRRKLRQ